MQKLNFLPVFFRIVWRAHDIYFLTARLQRRNTRPNRKNIHQYTSDSPRNYSACICYSEKGEKRSAQFLRCLNTSPWRKTLFFVDIHWTPSLPFCRLRRSRFKSQCQSSRLSPQWHHISIMINYTQQDNFKRNSISANAVIIHPRLDDYVWFWQVSSDETMTVS